MTFKRGNPFFDIKKTSNKTPTTLRKMNFSYVKSIKKGKLKGFNKPKRKKEKSEQNFLRI